MSPLSAHYPGFEDWYRLRVIPGAAAGSRKIVLVEREGVIAGVGIAKNEVGEKKLCTVRVAPEFAGRGMGVRLFGDLMDWLGDGKPHLTVGPHKMAEFERIFRHFDFNLTSVDVGRYRAGIPEYLFNEHPN